MSMIMHSSGDWPTVILQLEERAANLPGDLKKDVCQLINNFHIVVSQLSSEEVKCRQVNHQTRVHEKMMSNINEQLSDLTQLISFAGLLGV